MKKLNNDDIILMLSQATTPDVFRDQVNSNLSLMGPWGLNLRNSLKRLYFSETSMKHYKQVSGSVLKAAFTVVSTLFPGPVAGYGRRKSYLSYLLKLVEESDATRVFDHYALRIIIDDKNLTTDAGISYLYQSMHGIFEFFYQKNYLFKELTFTPDANVSEEILKQVYQPKVVPSFLNEYAGYVEKGIHHAYFKDRVMYPKANGFRGLTVVLISPEGLPIELQLWTTSMAFINEFGTANHDKVYKPQTPIDEVLHGKGPDFLSLKEKKILSDPLIKDTALQQFPRELLD